MSDDERAIADVIETWMAASAAGETDTVLSLMSDDVQFLTPGQPPFGKKEFMERQAGVAPYRMAARSHVKEIRVAGDWAYCITRLEVTMTPVTGGEPIAKQGHTMSIFRRLPNDRWVLARDANLLATV